MQAYSNFEKELEQMRRAFRGHDMEAPLPAGFLPAVSGAPVQAGMMLENRTILRSPPSSQTSSSAGPPPALCLSMSDVSFLTVVGIVWLQGLLPDHDVAYGEANADNGSFELHCMIC